MTGSPGLQAGLRAAVRVTVTDLDTAIAAGSGDLPVLATPRLLALAEAAAVAAVAPRLAPGQTSVGTAAELVHRRPCPVGAEIIVEAELTGIDGARLSFAFIARSPAAGPGRAVPAGQPEPQAAGADDGIVLGSGSMQRAVVGRAEFAARLAGPPGRPGQTPVVDRG
ncbi:MAG: thioesterase family protein [Streptosporangiaceae bacterium]